MKNTIILSFAVFILNLGIARAGDRTPALEEIFLESGQSVRVGDSKVYCDSRPQREYWRCSVYLCFIKNEKCDCNSTINRTSQRQSYDGLGSRAETIDTLLKQANKYVYGNNEFDYCAVNNDTLKCDQI